MKMAGTGGRRFDPSMSRRTRKPPPETAMTSSSDPEKAAEELPAERATLRRVSLQELITADGGGEEESEGGNGTVLCKLVDVMKEDLERNKLAIVAKQQQDGGEPAGRVRRYVRLLADLVKARRRSSKKKKELLAMR